MQKQSLEYFRSTGKFQDQTTIVKEVRAHKTDDFTTGNDVSYAKDVKLWFVMVRDTQNRFPDNKVWAEGWGWALINTDSPSKNTAKNFEADCKGCHLPASDTNWVFVEGYPALHE